MKRFLYLSSIFSVLLLSSCAFHTGMMTGNASLGDSDFQVLTVGTGSAKTTHVFSIGGLKMQALVNEARKNLYRTYPLGKNQVYANVAVDFKRSFFPFVSTTLATVTADIIQFGEVSKADSIKYLELINPASYPESTDSTSTDTFHSGKKVLIYKFNNGISVRIVSKVPQKSKYNVAYEWPKSGETTKVKESDIYLPAKNDSIPGVDFRVGDPINFNTGPNTILQTGVVYAIGTKKLLVKSGVLTLEAKIEDCMKLDNQGE